MLSRNILCIIVIYSFFISDVKGRGDRKESAIEDDVYYILLKVIKSNGKLTRPVKERTSNVFYIKKSAFIKKLRKILLHLWKNIITLVPKTLYYTCAQNLLHLWIYYTCAQNFITLVDFITLVPFITLVTTTGMSSA